MSTQDVLVVGLAVMGQNLALNMAAKGFKVAVYNRTGSVTDEFMRRAGQQAGITPAATLQEAVAGLSRPRRVFLMVKAGSAVDHVIDDLLPLLEPGDIIADGGNSHFRDTELRAETVSAKGLRFLGVGVSGGEEGALKGPSIMPGGDAEAYARFAPVLEAIAARADGEACVGWMGKGGAGHFVKMVHNGIEYGDMQLIAEAYDILGRAGGLSAPRQAEIFAAWNRGKLSSYLVETTSLVLRRVDEASGKPLVDMVLDSAAQKGTGRWTVEIALELGVPVPTLTAAVEARNMSALKAQRVRASNLLPPPPPGPAPDTASLTGDLEQALYAAKICSYAQGFALLAEADAHFDFGLELALAAKVWRAGCIIKAAFLDDIRVIFQHEPRLANLLLAQEFSQAVERCVPSLRRVASLAAQRGIPVPAFAASLAYHDAYRSQRLPANLIQAQRDCFGAHTFQRVDREGVFHANWAEKNDG